MLNGEATIVHLTVIMIKKTKYKRENIFQNKNPDMRVQLKKKCGKVRIVNFISAKCLPNAAGGLGVRCEPPSRSRGEPWWGPRGQSPQKISHIFL